MDCLSRLQTTAIEVADASGPAGVIEVVLPDAVVVRVAAGVDPVLLRRVVDALRTPAEVRS